MKCYLYLFIILLVVFSSASLVSASTKTCTPEEGYTFCYYNSYGDAYAKIQASNVQGKMYSNSTAGLSFAVPLNGSNQIYYNVKYMGDKLYYYAGLTSWGDVECGESGCDGKKISSGKYVVGSVGGSYNKCLGFVVWDKEGTDTDFDWAWVGGGWTTSCGTRYVINCYNNGNCEYLGAGAYCDKNSSDYNQWSCKLPNSCGDGKCVSPEDFSNCALDCNECQINTKKCIGYDYYNCDDTIPNKVGGNKYVLIQKNSTSCNYVPPSNQTQQNDIINPSSSEIWEQIKEIATKPVFKISTFQVVVWHLLILLFLFSFLFRR